MYQTIEFSRLLSLVPFATEFRLERAIVDVARSNELQVQFIIITLRAVLEIKQNPTYKGTDNSHFKLRVTRWSVV